MPFSGSGRTKRSRAAPAEPLSFATVGRPDGLNGEYIYGDNEKGSERAKKWYHYWGQGNVMEVYNALVETHFGPLKG